MGCQVDDSESRFARYVEGLASVIGHADRTGPLRDYCTGLMLPGERKSVEPMAAISLTCVGTGSRAASSTRSPNRAVRPDACETRPSLIDCMSAVTLYWLTNTGTPSSRSYWDAAQGGGVAVTIFPGEIYRAPRSWGEQNWMYGCKHIGEECYT
jgi:hypothetical protein